MNSLPQEIIDHISAISFQDQVKAVGIAPFADLPFDRPLLATISRRWQYAIERQSFSVINLKSTDLHIFQQAVTGHRRRFLESLRYTIILPAYSEEACTQFERDADRQINSAAFTTALYGLFQILQSWGSISDSGSPYALCVIVKGIYSPTDNNRRQSSVRPARVYRRHLRAGDPVTVHQRHLYSYRFHFSSLHLLQPIDLPVVPAIRRFVAFHGGGYNRRTIAPESILEIMAKAPRLKSVWLSYVDRLTSHPALRRTRRDAFTQALERVRLSPSITGVVISTNPAKISNQSWQPSRLAYPGVNCDLLSDTIRRATANLPDLAVLHIHGVIDSSLFWPASPGLVIQPFWQNLRTLLVTFDPTTPSGEWYFKGEDKRDTYPFPLVTAPASETQMPPGYGFSEEEDIAAALEFSVPTFHAQSGKRPFDNIFRSTVDKRLVVPLLEAFAKACTQMPLLEMAQLGTNLWELVEFRWETYTRSGEWVILYSIPGCYHRRHHREPPLSYPTDSALRRTLIFDTRDWRPSEELCSLFQSIGQGKYSEEPIIRHVDRWGSMGKQMALDELARPRGE